MFSQPLGGHDLEEIICCFWICAEKEQIEKEAKGRCESPGHKTGSEKNTEKNERQGVVEGKRQKNETKNDGRKRQSLRVSHPRPGSQPSRTSRLHLPHLVRALKSAQVYIFTPIVATRPTPRNLVLTEPLEGIKQFDQRSQLERFQVGQ